MNRWIQSTLGLSFAALIALVAAHGVKFFEALQAAWLFLLKLAEGAPMGLTSFLLALALATVSQPYLRRVLPAMRCDRTREFLVESVALAIGVLVMWVQLRTVQGMLLGLLVGFVAPYLQKAIVASFSVIRKGGEQ